MGRTVKGRGARPIADGDLHHGNCIQRPKAWEFLIAEVMKK